MVTATTTVTATATATATATVRVTVRPTATVTVQPTAAPASASPRATAPAVSSDFDRAWLLAKSRDAIEDIRTVDRRLNDGIMVSSALYLLSDSYARMADAGTPPGVDAASYQSRLATLSQFAELAGDEYDASPMQGSARYQVVRNQTGILFAQINGALSTQLRLP